MTRALCFALIVPADYVGKHWSHANRQSGVHFKTPRSDRTSLNRPHNFLS